MIGKLIERTPAACNTPLLIGSLLETGVARAPQEQIVYADKRRLAYRDLGERVSRLASALAGLGVQPGDTVGVMDWDTHRYLECYFAVPMMGAVLFTINVRLSPEQILYTINHAEASVILVNAAFLPVLELEWERVAPGKKLVLLNDLETVPKTPLPLCAEYEAMLTDADPHFRFPELDEDTLATVFYTTGTTGLPKGVYYSHRQLVLHTLALRAALTGPGHGRLNEVGVYMPITPMFHVHAWGMPYLATILSALAGKPRKPTTKVGAMRAIRREAAAIGRTGEAVLALSPGLLEGWLDPAAWRDQLIAAAEPAGSDEQGEPTDGKERRPPELDHIAFRAGTKQALIAGLLHRDQGATLDELIATTGWLPHTTRAALTGLRRKGCTLEKSTRENGKTAYRIVPPDGAAGGAAPSVAA